MAIDAIAAVAVTVAVVVLVAALRFPPLSCIVLYYLSCTALGSGHALRCDSRRFGVSFAISVLHSCVGHRRVRLR